MIDIYTDGSCLGNPGPGGWAAIVVEGGVKRNLSGGAPGTTNNRMELSAAIEGLEAVLKNAAVTVHSDSQHLVNTMTRNWKRKVNLDLWGSLDSLVASREVRWKWVKGHAGHPGNEEANDLAIREAKDFASGRGGAGTKAAKRETASRTKAVGVQAAPTDERSETADVGAGQTPEKVLTHLDSQGRAQMVDVGDKAVTKREAVARGFVSMLPETLALITGGKVEKGDVLATARLAGIMAAKQTSQLIPLCHPLPLSRVTVELSPDADDGGVTIEASVRTEGRTGVEMEALTAVSVAALTVYDMCKAVDRGMRIQSVRLAKKSGGQSGDIVLED